MSSQVGAYINPFPNTFRRTAEIPRPVWVIIDTHEDSLVDGWFDFADYAPQAADPAYYRWESLPAGRHNGSSDISFSDGHVEQHKWVDGRTIVPVKRVWQGGPAVPYSKDVGWLRQQCAP